MSTLQMMLDEINGVSTPAAAVSMVKRWVEFPESVTPDAASGPTGTRN